MKFFYILATTLLLCTPVFAQTKHDNIWTLGYGKVTTHATGPNFGGMLYDFGAPGNIKRQDFQNGFVLSCISDRLGNLVAYTDGCAIYNKFSQKVPNGDTLSPGVAFNLFCANDYPLFQGTLFLPMNDGKKDQYYLFHIRLDNLYWYPTELYYTIINQINNDSIEVSDRKRQLIVRDSLAMSEYVTAVRHGNGRDWWVVVPQFYKDGYHVSLLTPKGLVYQGIQGTQDSINNWVCCGQAAFSTDGSRYFLNLQRQGLRMLDFDRCTGRFSNYRLFPQKDSTDWALGGVATSPSGRFLYVAANTKVFQYDLWASDFLASQTTVAVYDGFQSPYPTRFFQMMLGPDDSIYICSTNANDVLHVIHKPDEAGMACAVEQHGIKLPSRTAFILPNMANFRLGALKGSPCDTITLSASEPKHGPVIADGMDVYPNPTADLIYFEKLSFQQGRSGLLRLYNTHGSMVLESAFPKEQNTLQLSVAHLPAGMYVWAYLNEQGLHVGGRFIR